MFLFLVHLCLCLAKVVLTLLLVGDVNVLLLGHLEVSWICRLFFDVLCRWFFGGRRLTFPWLH